MIKTRSDLKLYLRIEEKIYQKNMNNMLWLFLKYLPLPVFENAILYKYVKILRKTEYHSYKNNRIRKTIYKIRLRRLGYKYGLSIPTNVFGAGLYIRHLAQTRVSSQSTIGENFKIHPFVSVGTNNNDESPAIGHNVTIYSGARVIGGITLADDISVAANAVVTKSCNIRGAVLAGVPAKIIKKTTD